MSRKSLAVTFAAAALLGTAVLSACHAMDSRSLRAHLAHTTQILSIPHFKNPGSGPFPKVLPNAPRPIGPISTLMPRIPNGDRPQFHRPWLTYNPNLNVHYWRPANWTAPILMTGGIAAPTTTYASRLASITNPNNCLTKEYTPQGAVVFRDVCTNEVAMNPPLNASPTAYIPQQQMPQQLMQQGYLQPQAQPPQVQ